MKTRFMAAAVAVLMSTGSAYATPVVFSTPTSVPNTFAGLYINLATGATGSTASGVTGWDINLYNSATSLSFFFGANGGAGVAGTTTGPYLDLAPGSVVSSASTFAVSTASANTAAFQVPGTHTLGFRFVNESTSATNYGYMTLTSGGPNGFPLSISGWAFENDGGAITVPGLAAAVPEPASWAMMIFGLGAVGSAMRRRRNVAVKVSYAA